MCVCVSENQDQACGCSRNPTAGTPAWVQMLRAPQMKSNPLRLLSPVSPHLLFSLDAQ